MSSPAVPTVGYPSEVPAFWNRNQGLAEIVGDVRTLAAEVFADRIHEISTKWGVVAFAVLAPVYEQFEEIICLAANGFGRASQARVRTMFEHVALSAVFQKKPEYAERFIQFQGVEKKKELERALALYSRNSSAEFLESIEAEISKLDTRTSELQSRFGKSFKRSWHDGFEKIAEILGWEHHYFYDYLLPNKWVHASALITERSVSDDSSDQLFVDCAPDYDAADEATRSACTLMALAFAVASDLLDPEISIKARVISGRLVDIYKDRPNKHKL